MNHILKWNQIALEANKTDFSGSAPEQGGPTLSSRALALVHIAMYDAHFGAGQFTRYQSFLGLPPAPVGTDPALAVAVAAHHVLSHLFGAQKPKFDQELGVVGSAFGTQVGAATIAEKFGKLPPLAMPYPMRSDRYNHQADPFNQGQGLHGQLYGRATTFAVRNPMALDAPPTPGMPAYDNDAKEVRNKGAHPGYKELTRTPDETMIAQYWAFDGVNKIGTPPRLYNQIILEIMKSRGTEDPDDQIRLLALANVAMGDSGILAWHEKFKHNLWRPVIGIRQHDSSCGPAAVAGTIEGSIADPFWEPLGAPKTNSADKRFTPPFPAYPSGHATFGAAALQMVRRFYGQPTTKLRKDDTISFDFISDEQDGKSDYEGNLRTKHRRKFSSCWAAIYENAVSRVFLGVHWRLDAMESENYGEFKTGKGIGKIGGVPLGLNIADDIFENKMKA
jgi:membrane-associated phospholipid phosphatase